MPHITAANAKEYAARSVIARKAAKEERAQRLAENKLLALPNPIEQQGISVACVRKRLEELDNLMAQAETDKQWDNYSRAYDRMFRVWCVLTKTPSPGQWKPKPIPTKAAGPSQSDPEPIAPQ